MIPTQQYVFTATLDRVIDGDTIQVQLDQGLHTYRAERLRLLRVNAPEVHGPSKPAGDAATAYTTDWLAGQQLVISTYKSDVFGRYLAEVWRTSDGANLNDDLLASGHAVPFVR